MDDLNSGADAAEHDGDEDAISQAVASLNEIADQLRGLADFAAALCDEAIFEPTFH